MTYREFLRSDRQGDQVHEIYTVQEEVSSLNPEQATEWVQVIPSHIEKTTRISSKLSIETKEALIACLQRNQDIFVWAPEDLRGSIH